MFALAGGDATRRLDAHDRGTGATVPLSVSCERDRAKAIVVRGHASLALRTRLRDAWHTPTP